MSTENTPATIDNKDAGLYRAGDTSRYSETDRDRLRAMMNAGNASDADLDHLMAYAHQSGLNPLLKEIYLVPRTANVGGKYQTVWAVQVSIDGFRKATHRYADSRGENVIFHEPRFIDSKGTEHPYWLPAYGPHPEAAIVTIQVGDSAATNVATWAEYAQVKKDGTPTSMWQKFGPTMLAKCAEAGAHRKICPLTAGLYEDAEMHQPEPAVQRVEYTPTKVDPIAAIRCATTMQELNEIATSTHDEANWNQIRDALNTRYSELKEAEA